MVNPPLDGMWHRDLRWCSERATWLGASEPLATALMGGSLHLDTQKIRGYTYSRIWQSQVSRNSS